MTEKRAYIQLAPFCDPNKIVQLKGLKFDSVIQKPFYSKDYVKAVDFSFIMDINKLLDTSEKNFHVITFFLFPSTQMINLVLDTLYNHKCKIYFLFPNKVNKHYEGVDLKMFEKYAAYYDLYSLKILSNYKDIAYNEFGALRDAFFVARQSAMHNLFLFMASYRDTFNYIEVDVEDLSTYVKNNKRAKKLFSKLSL